MASLDGWIGRVRIVLLTGSPGVGKTTLVRRIADGLVARGVKVAGIATSEVRESGMRTGFRITDLSTGEEGWLARKDPRGGSRIGSYRVISEDLERVGVEALRRAADDRTDLAIVDEIGPMEMTSTSFRSALVKVFQGAQPTLATVKLGSRYEEVERIREKCLQLELTEKNREQIYSVLIDQIDDWVNRKELENH
jgi:nucleoside-triphosphatase